MSKIDPVVRKEIVKTLHWAIDSEMLNNDNNAYRYYIESLALVAEALRKDCLIQEPILTVKDKWNLIEFAKQSIFRVSVLLKKEVCPSDGKSERGVSSPLPSAPAESVSPEARVEQSPSSIVREESPSQEEVRMMARYQRRLGLASNVVDKQNIELEMARHLVEKAALSRNRLVRATAWAMQNAHKKFQMEEKLRSGILRESDFRKQQLYAISYQFGEGNVWLTELLEELTVYPGQEKIVRELLDNVLTDNSHPIKATINQMQDKVNHMISDALSEKVNFSTESLETVLEENTRVIKEDINIIHDVLKALFDPLKTDKNSSITLEVVHHVYFAQVKHSIIALIREVQKDVEEGLRTKMETGYEESREELTEECREAVTKLHYLTTLHNPYDMLDCTVHVIRLLASSNFDKHHCTSMGADDILPRLCQVVLSSGLPAVCAEAYFMETFMPSEKALGEEGYAITMLQSVITHLTSF